MTTRTNLMIFFVLTVIFLLSGFSGDQDISTQESIFQASPNTLFEERLDLQNDPVWHPALAVDGPNLCVNPRLDFGTIEIGKEERTALVLENCGAKSLTIYNTSGLQGPDADSFYVEHPKNVFIPGFNKCYIWANYRPIAPKSGSFVASLDVWSTDKNIRVSLIGKSKLPDGTTTRGPYARPSMPHCSYFSKNWPLVFTNDCTKPVQLALKYRQGGQWRTAGMWSQDPKRNSTLAYDGELVGIDQKSFYYYATTMDGSIVWRGRYNVDFQGKTLPMRQIDVALDDYKSYLTLTCN